MWFRKRAETPDEILAVNSLKITKSAKMSFSILPSSGLVTQSLLYIYNVDVEEAGVYSCGVNTDPMIIQVGGPFLFFFRNPTRHVFHNTLKSQIMKLQKGSLEVFTKPEPPRPSPGPAPGTVLVKNGVTISRETNPDSDSTTFCFNFPKMWRETRREAEAFVADVWKRVSSIF